MWSLAPEPHQPASTHERQAHVWKVSLALEPPVAISTARIGEGLLSLRFPRTRLHAASAPVGVQARLRNIRPITRHSCWWWELCSHARTYMRQQTMSLLSRIVCFEGLL